MTTHRLSAEGERVVQSLLSVRAGQTRYSTPCE
jgi:hypothetical protein